MPERREPFSVRSGQALHELREAVHFAVEIPEPKPDDALPGSPAGALDAVAAKVGAETAVHLLESYFPTRQVHANWQTVGRPRCHGEFCLSNIATCLTEQQPSLGDPALPPHEQGILAELLIIDENPFSGTGNAAGIRLTGSSPAPEIWFHDAARSRLNLLEPDYPAYLDAALLTKGASGWQYLFADADLGERPLRAVAENLDTALALLPDAFPDHDYADLHARLDARR